MRVFVDTETGVISGYTIDPNEQHTGEPAPVGYTHETWLDWIANQTAQDAIEMAMDAAEANARRNPPPLEPAPE